MSHNTIKALANDIQCCKMKKRRQKSAKTPISLCLEIKGRIIFFAVVYHSLVLISVHFHVERELTAHLNAGREI